MADTRTPPVVKDPDEEFDPVIPKMVSPERVMEVAVGMMAVAMFRAKDRNSHASAADMGERAQRVLSGLIQDMAGMAKVARDQEKVKY